MLDSVYDMFDIYLTAETFGLGYDDYNQITESYGEQPTSREYRFHRSWSLGEWKFETSYRKHNLTHG